MTPANSDAVSTELLFERHAGFVARFLYRLGASAESVDDLVQEVFLAVHRQGGYRPGSASPMTYLAGVASKLFANEQRKASTRRRFMRLLQSVRGEDAQQVTPAELAEANQTQRALWRALDTLDHDERAVLVMADLELLPCPEIASALSVPLGTIYFRLHAARKRWMRELERTHTDLSRLPRLAPERSQ